MATSIKRYYWAATYLFISSIFIAAYHPGLFGGFLLDDFGNVDKLGDYNGVRNLDTFIQFFTSGIAGPTGRPISLLSFLLNANTWPANPYPFKLTNVILHALNGYLLLLIIQQILSAVAIPATKASWIALISCALWLLHPYHVSTVLYVVQRMAMLSTFFSLIGILLYCHGRLKLSNDQKSAYRFMTSGIVLGTILATLSKENGALLPILLLCIEATIFSSPSCTLPRLRKRWLAVFLILPTVVIIGYLLSRINFSHFDAPMGQREFSQKQRLLTESRLVIGYLYNLLIPQMFYSGIFNESIRLSHSLLDPISTLPSVLLVITLPTAAYWLRKKHPFLALAVLFFFAGHLLESTTIGLELYFEHRNYLPSLFLFLPLAYYPLSSQLKTWRFAIIGYAAVCALFTYQRSTLWGNPVELSLFWAKQNQQSSRAQRTAALTLEKYGNPQAALEILTQGKANIPDSLDIKLHWAMQKCAISNLTSEDAAGLSQAALANPYTTSYYNLLEAFVLQANQKQCSELNPQLALTILSGLDNNPSILKNHRVSFQFDHLRGLIYLHTEHPKLAYNEFHNALAKTQRIGHGLLQSSLLASYGEYKLALQHLDYTETLLPSYQAVDYFSSKHGDELVYLRQQIESDAKQTLQTHETKHQHRPASKE
ncbi:hypothetical protein Q9L42_011530 [Methylomarinum sp. Ch1-1]|uniref:Tetratricopeptide repeat protein n=1 Tax=Methylomarinum roseum TaxID=3067653 RepID=A0AAU7NPU9_9GAMM|nr:hypothetical protein [Methylomarinum sp. Ch1-1]MDP4521071.1 hypothetical protein [Methylomarinum sp. Ch1-1]